MSNNIFGLQNTQEELRHSVCLNDMALHEAPQNIPHPEHIIVDSKEIRKPLKANPLPSEQFESAQLGQDLFTERANLQGGHSLENEAVLFLDKLKNDGLFAQDCVSEEQQEKRYTALNDAYIQARSACLSYRLCPQEGGGALQESRWREVSSEISAALEAITPNGLELKAKAHLENIKLSPRQIQSAKYKAKNENKSTIRMLLEEEIKPELHVDISRRCSKLTRALRMAEQETDEVSKRRCMLRALTEASQRVEDTMVVSSKAQELIAGEQTEENQITQQQLHYRNWVYKGILQQLTELIEEKKAETSFDVESYQKTIDGTRKKMRNRINEGIELEEEWNKEPSHDVPAVQADFAFTPFVEPEQIARLISEYRLAQYRTKSS